MSREQLEDMVCEAFSDEMRFKRYVYIYLITMASGGYGPRALALSAATQCALTSAASTAESATANKLIINQHIIYIYNSAVA